MKWYEYINIETVVIAFIFIVVVYCILTKKRTSRSKNNKFKFNDISFDNIKRKGSGWWNYSVSKNKVKKPRYNKHEEKCREIFQKIFRVPFKSVRPDWLKNPTTNRNLELDGYNPTIPTPLGAGLAFEYDGAQHSKHTKIYHRDPKDFEYQIAKDKYKDKLCKDHRVTLIRIPHFVAYEDLERYIRQSLKNHGL